MIESVYQWMKNIIVFLILSTVVLNLLGKSNYKKYVGLIIGLILVLLVIRPVLLLTQNTDFMDFSLDSYGSLSEAQDLSSEIFAMEEQSTIDILLEYKLVIQKQTDKLIAEKGLEVVSMSMEVEEDKMSSEFGSIRNMSIVARYKTANEKKENFEEVALVKTITIDQIELEKEEEKVDITQQNSLSPMEIVIKNLLSDFYNMDSNNINITIQEDRDGK